MNLTDYKTTPLHVAFEECCREASVRMCVCVHACVCVCVCVHALCVCVCVCVCVCPLVPPQELSLPVVGSEVVGLLPLEAVLMAAEHYINKESLFVLQESQKVRLVVDRLRLSSVSEFKPEEKIIE